MLASATLLIVFLALVFTQVPVAVVFGVSSIFAFIVSGQYPLIILIQRMFDGIDSYTLIAIPMFILVGRLLNESSATERIFSFVNTITGNIKGGLGHANILASVIFAGMSGSAVADASGLGRVEIEAMEKRGYPKGFSCAITLASSVIGPIIPPSIPMIIYGCMAGESIIKLFAGGVIPGLMMGLSLMFMVYIIAMRRPDFPITQKKRNLGDIWSSFKGAFPALMAPIIILGGIFSGIYTPTESSVAAVVYVAIIDRFIYKKLKIKDYRRIFIQTIIDSGALMIIISTANIFAWLVIIQRLPNIFVNSLLSFTNNPYIILFIINILLLFLGCFVEGIAIMLILIPILVPLITILGISPIHFGVVMVLNIMLGNITPPMGMGLFAVNNITGISVTELSKSLIPFYIPLIIVLFLVTYFPKIVMFLPNLL